MLENMLPWDLLNCNKKVVMKCLDNAQYSVVSFLCLFSNVFV